MISGNKMDVVDLFKNHFRKFSFDILRVRLFLKLEICEQISKVI